MVLASVVTPFRATALDVGSFACGPYTILHDLPRITPIGLKGDPTRLRVYRSSQLVWSLSEGEAITEVECRSLTGDGVPGLIFTTFSYGAHCCTTIYIVSLGSLPQLLLQYFAGNAHTYEIHHLKGNGKVELMMGDDSFAYFGGLSYAGSPAWLPLVACYQNKAFYDCTREFPQVIRNDIQRYRSELKDLEARIKSGELDKSWKDIGPAGPALGMYANFVLLGQDNVGWTFVRSQVASKPVLEWLTCHRLTVQRWAKRREAILHSPKPHQIWETPGCKNL
jgi:hypothetical protein